MTSAARTWRSRLERLDALVCGENRLSPGAILIAASARRRSGSGSRRRRIRSRLWRTFFAGLRARAMCADYRRSGNDAT